MDLKKQIIKFLNEETEQYRCTESGDCRAIGVDTKEDTEYLADELIKLFSLHIVSHSYYQVVFDGRNDDMQEVTAGLKTLEEAKQALEDNKKHFDEPMYIVAKINWR